MNIMIQKRTALVTKVQELLDAVTPEFRVVDRFKREVIMSESRADRIRVMGDPTKYAEVIYEPNTASGPSAGATWTNKVHLFQIRVWLGFTDSSQDVWDELIEGDNGLMKGLQDTAKVGNFILFNPQQPFQAMRFLDGEGKEISHYIEFTITIR